MVNIKQLNTSTIEGKQYTYPYIILYGYGSSIECIVEDFSIIRYDETCTYIIVVEEHHIDLEGVNDELAVVMDGIAFIQQYVIQKGYERKWWKQ